ncbi:flagellar hook-associated protein 1 FlgK [Rhodovulum bhavnagarense]|uniref:Flagellar hook-associated protein 1 n=1 Tax=Rhodovulum bhavnagarense TaxID=992286 RepID=A0A4R2RES1_9RHOB|nr:flagellar basal body rod C-terminal domain-containing protein [Rhodovulum bhavnagarense]TCP61343.1 flagellar hook-associated protein 1 FlgK [Rhodovulum bhavnagarense]
MTTIANIALNGLQSYRAALGVTGENIANVETDGYVRRQALPQEAGAARGSLTSVAQSGTGVQSVDIRRALDALAAAQVRSADSDVAASETMLGALSGLEGRLTDGMGGLTEMLDHFMDSFSDAAAAPDASALRAAIRTAGEGMAGAIADIARDIVAMSEGLADQAVQAVGIANDLLQGLAEVQVRIQEAGSGPALNPLLDQRDLLVNELARTFGITVLPEADNLVRITLGSSPGGPLLLDRGTPSAVTVDDAGRLSVRAVTPGAPSYTRWPETGLSGGLATAIGAIDGVLSEIDAWARNLAADMNAVHAGGRTTSGEPGGPLFSLDGWSVRAAVNNAGSAFATVEGADAALAPAGELSFVYASGQWQARDAEGTLLASGTDRIDLPGLGVQFTGTASEGDRLFLTPTHGSAVNMRWLVEDNDDLAAGGAYSVAPAATNAGGATITAQPSVTTDAGLVELDGLFGTTAETLSAVEFLSDGSVALLPANAQSATLLTLATQSAIRISPPGGVSGAGSLTFTLDGVARTIDLSGASPELADAADLAARLNAATFTAAGHGLAELGLQAGAENGALILTAATGMLSAAALDDTPGTPESSIAPASGLMVFTRDGQQLAGPPLDAASAAALLTESNGFFPDARYADAALASASYRGMTIAEASVQGLYSGRLDIGGATLAWSGSPAPIAAAAQEIEVFRDGQSLGTLSLPGGSSAASAASGISEAFGIATEAETRAYVSASADGTVGFQLTGDNLAPLAVSAAVTAGQLFGLADKVNALSGQTGIRAEATADGLGMVLVHEGGESIGISGLTGGPLDVTRQDAAGQALDAEAITLGADYDSARIMGTVTLRSAGDFEASLDGVASDIAIDPFAGSLVSRSLDAAGSLLRFDFAYEPGIDSGDGASSAGAARYGVTIDPGGLNLTATVDSLVDDLNSAEDVARALASALEPGVPADMTIAVEGATLVIRTANGTLPEVSVSATSLASQRVTLENLPPEDLLVVMTGEGALRLAGAIAPATAYPPNALELRVLDGAAGRVGLFDSQAGIQIGERFLDADGRIAFGGFDFVISGNPATGDSFVLNSGAAGPGDGRTFGALGDLATSSPESGQGGFGALYTEILTGIGAKVAAEQTRATSLTAVKERAERAMAEASAVDLDTEAARLMSYQQAYQANAQVLKIAGELFDTLLQSI